MSALQDRIALAAEDYTRELLAKSVREGATFFAELTELEREIVLNLMQVSYCEGGRAATELVMEDVP